MFLVDGERPAHQHASAPARQRSNAPNTLSLQMQVISANRVAVCVQTVPDLHSPGSGSPSQWAKAINHNEAFVLSRVFSDLRGDRLPFTQYHFYKTNFVIQQAVALLLFVFRIAIHITIKFLLGFAFQTSH